MNIIAFRLGPPGGGGPVGIATRNCPPAGHALRRLLWLHTFGTQYSNQIATAGQMVQGGDFAGIFSFTHAGGEAETSLELRLR